MSNNDFFINNQKEYNLKANVMIIQVRYDTMYEVWNFNCGNYLFTTDTK